MGNKDIIFLLFESLRRNKRKRSSRIKVSQNISAIFEPTFENIEYFKTEMI
nr:hypothetical protein [Entomoplasma sp. MP1]